MKCPALAASVQTGRQSHAPSILIIYKGMYKEYINKTTVKTKNQDLQLSQLNNFLSTQMHKTESNSQDWFGACMASNRTQAYVYLWCCSNSAFSPFVRSSLFVVCMHVCLHVCLHLCLCAVLGTNPESADADCVHAI